MNRTTNTYKGTQPTVTCSDEIPGFAIFVYSSNRAHNEQTTNINLIGYPVLLKMPQKSSSTSYTRTVASTQFLKDMNITQITTQTNLNHLAYLCNGNSSLFRRKHIILSNLYHSISKNSAR